MCRPVQRKTEIVVKYEEQDIKEILADHGLLCYDQPQHNSKEKEHLAADRESVNGDFRSSVKSSFKSYSHSDSNDHQICN